MNYSLDLLKAETSEVDLVGPSLSALKVILDFPADLKPEASEKASRLIHGLFSACLQNVDEMK